MENEVHCRAAFAQTDITPGFQVELIGCYRPDGRSQGVVHPLCAQVLLLEQHNEYYCLVTIDSLGFTTTLSGKLRHMITGLLKTGISNVMVGFSHTHSAPAPLSPVNGEKYYHLVYDRLEKCVAEAMVKMKPCKAGWALTNTSIGENRRDGCSTVDNRLGGLEITDSGTGNTIAVVLRVTAHANILMSCNNKISSDYFHVAREKLGDLFHGPVMLLQGAAGDVKPAGVDKINGGDIQDLYRISDILLDSAKQLHFDPEEINNLQMYSRKMEYYSDVPSETEASRISDTARNLFDIDGSEWLAECDRLRRSGTRVQVQEGEIQFFCLNGGCFCGVPDEIFCEISLEASDRVHSPYLFLNGYTNGCTGYLPHASEWVKGGYETLFSYLQYYKFHGHVMPYRKDTAERIIEIVCSECKKMHLSGNT
jgi:hypothetical protein